jgi:rod shape-determining protein MreC
VIAVHDSRRTRLVLGVLLIAALALIAVSYSDGSSKLLGSVRRVSGSVFGGVEHAATTAAGSVSRFFGSGSGSAAASGRITALEQQVIRLRAALSQAELSKTDYRQLSRLLQLAGRGRYRIAPATVIAFGQGYQQTVTLDVGSADGVRPQQTVLDGHGLVGEVTSVTPQTATVLLATDGAAKVGVRLAPSGEIGWVTGQGKAATGTTLLKLTLINSAFLKPGEQLVTAASVRDRPFVPGVPVGYITRVQSSGPTPQALVRPYADFSSLDVVGVVIVPPRHNPHYSVLPPPLHPRPTPTVTVTVTPSASPTPTYSPGAGG